MRRMPFGGFTLVEIMMTLTLMSVVISLGLVLLRGGVASADSHALALGLAAQLRQARQRAIASQETMAVILPGHSGVGNVPISQSIYLATGLSRARETHIVNFKNNYPGAELFAGCWPVGGGSSFSIFPSQSNQRYGAFNVSGWLSDPSASSNPMLSDYAIIFLPDGSVQTNGLPYLADGSTGNGAYYLIATAGCTFGPASTPSNPGGQASSLSYFNPTALVRPWAVGVTSGGEVTVESGLPRQQPGSLQLLGAPISIGSEVGLAPEVPPLPAFNCSCLPAQGATGCWLAPATNTTSLMPAGVNMTLAPGRRLTLAVNVSDNSGRDLYVEWSCQAASNNHPGTDPAGGNFSFSAPERMSWDPLNQVWTSTWDWLCPINAETGDIFTFSCAFGDGALAGMTAYTAAQQTVMAKKGAKIWIEAYQLGTTDQHCCLFNANEDGSDLALRLMGPSANSLQTSQPVLISSISNDGSVAAVLTDGGYQISSGLSGAILYNVTVPGFRQSSNPSSYQPLVVSSRGDQIALGKYDSGSDTLSLQIGPLNGPFSTIFSETGFQKFSSIVWSPDESQIVFVDSSARGGDIKVISKTAGRWGRATPIPPAPGLGWGGQPIQSGLSAQGIAPPTATTWPGPPGDWSSWAVGAAPCYQPDGRALYFTYNLHSFSGASSHQICKWDPTTPTVPPIQWSNLSAAISQSPQGLLACTPDGRIIYQASDAKLYSLPNQNGASSNDPLGCSGFLLDRTDGVLGVFITNQ